MTVQIPRPLVTGALAVLVFYGLLGTEVQCTQAEARPSLADLQAQIDEMRAQEVRVFDGDGNELGGFAGRRSGSRLIEIVHSMHGVTMLVDAVDGAPSGGAFFTEPDCTGQAFQNNDFVNALVAVGTSVVPSGFLVGRVADPVPATIQSVGSPSGCTNATGSTDTAYLLDEFTGELGWVFPLATPLWVGARLSGP
jgi:hypothetical protein